MPAVALVQACSFAASIALASVLGATPATDAYLLAGAVPLLVYGVLLAGLRTGVIPALTEERQSADGFSKASSELLSAVLVLSIAGSAVATTTAFIAAPLLTASGNNVELASVQTMLLEFAPLGVLGAIVGVLGAILTVRGRSALPVLALALDPVARTAMVLSFGAAIGPSALIIGSLAGNCIAVLLLVWVLIRVERVRVRIALVVRTPFVLASLGTSAPLVVGQALLQFNPIVNRSIATSFGGGSVTVLELGFRIFSVPLTLFGSMLIAPLAAAWAARFREGGWEALAKSLREALRAILLVLPPVVALGIVLSDEVVAALYQGGAFTGAQARQTASVLSLLLLGLPAQLAVIPLATVFIVQKVSVVPMQIAFANVTLNLLLILGLRPFLGLESIAASTSLTMATLALAYGVAARRRFGPLGLRALRGTLIRAICSGCLLALMAAWLLDSLPGPSGRLEATALLLAITVVGIGAHGLVLLGGQDRTARDAAQRLCVYFRQG